MELTKYKVCPECGKHNLPSLLECRYCESDLTGIRVVDSETEQKQGAKNQQPVVPVVSELVRICECGAENPPQARKCSVCGEDISDIIPCQKQGQVVAELSYELRSVDGSFTAMVDKPVFIIGREVELRNYLADKIYVSRRHAKITIVAGKLFIENLSGTNKTYLNNEEISETVPTAISSGDEIGLGGKVVDGCRQEEAAYFILQVKT